MTSVFSDFSLDTRILKALEKCKYLNPTPIQERSIPEILNQKDLIACAQTGTGKTAAFVLPILQRLTHKSDTPKKPRILILTPTRELAAQINKAVYNYGEFLKISLTSLVGGAGYKNQIRDLSKPFLDIIVATPGRLMDHMENRRVDLSGIEVLVLDEADRMLDMGFVDAVLEIAKRTPKNRQTLLFSATIDDKLSTITKKILRDPINIHIASETKAPALITQEIYFVNDDKHKMQLLKHFMDNESIYKAVIFSATKINADRLSKELNAAGYKTEALHGDLNQSRRNRALALFNSGKVQYLIATDVAARGINIVNVTHVFNYDLPKFCEDYVHRIGRTGRAGKSGKAISFALSSDARNIMRIEKFIKAKLPRCVVDGLEPKANIEKLGSISPSKSKSRKSARSDRFKSDRKSGSRESSKDFSDRRERRGGAPDRKRSKFNSDDRRSRDSFGDAPRRNSSEGKRSKFSSDDRRSRDSFGDAPRRNSSEGKRAYRKREDYSFDSEKRQETQYAPRRSPKSFSEDKRGSFKKNERRFDSDKNQKREFSKGKSTRDRRGYLSEEGYHAPRHENQYASDNRAPTQAYTRGKYSNSPTPVDISYKKKSKKISKGKEIEKRDRN